MQPPPLTRLPRPVFVRSQTLAANTHFAPHRHDWVQFLYALSGMLRVALPTGSFVVPPRYAMWVPAGVRHQVSALGKVEFCSLYIETEAASATASPDRCRVVEVMSLARELIVAAAELPVEYDQHGRAGRLIATLLDVLAGLQETDIYLPTPTEPRLRHICDALFEDPADDRELGTWAANFNVSTRTLARLFVDQTSMGFRAWRQRLRLYRALELLTGGASVTTVALEIGYSSSSAFIAAFREQFGKAPGEFFQ